MENDTRPLSGGDIHWRAERVADGTGTPEEARELIAEFVRQARASRLEPRLIEHFSDCFAAFLAGERHLLPVPEAGRFAPTPVPIQSLEKAFGLTRTTRGRPSTDRETRCAVAMAVLGRMLSGETLEVAAEMVASERRQKCLPISSETEVRDAWARHKLDGLLWLRVSRLPEVDKSAAPWAPREVERLTVLFKDVPGFIPPGMSVQDYWRKALPDEPLPHTVTPDNSANKPA
jgi:hypothetical protein